MKSITVARLQTLVDFLKTVEPNRFDLDYWRNRPDLDNLLRVDANHSAAIVTDEELKNECGTTACAMGWACTIPEFQQSGLIYQMDNNCGCTICYNTDNPKELPNHANTLAAKYYGVDAIKLFFVFNSHHTAQLLFYPHNYQKEGDTSINEVIDRIEKFITFYNHPTDDRRENCSPEAWAEYLLYLEVHDLGDYQKSTWAKFQPSLFFPR